MSDDDPAPQCSRSQTVPDMSRLDRGVTTPDSLLSETGDLNEDKTQDSALSDRLTNSKSPSPSPHLKLNRLDGVFSAWNQDRDARIMTAWSDMVGREQDTLVHRVNTLEKKVNLQNDEITCLKATLSECLRRLNTLETKPQVEISRDSPEPTSVSKIPQRRPHSAQEGEKTRGSSPRNTGKPYRKWNSSNQPAGSATVGTVEESSRSDNCTTPKLTHRAGTAGNRRLSGSMGRLHKKWRSTSDFESPAPLSVYKRPSTGSSLSFRSPASTPYSSQHNLDQLLREKQQLNPDPVYSHEDGTIRLCVRGRQVSLPCPTSLLDTYQPQAVNQPPYKHLRLEWVYGYRGRDARSNLSMLPTGEAIYFTASVVVLHNLQEHTQRHYLGHTEDIRSLAIHPNRMIAATGQGEGYYRRQGDPHVQVWNTVSLQTLHVLGRGCSRTAFSALSFSKTDGGLWLVGVDEAPDHSIFLWDWAKGTKQLETKCASETVVCVEFHPVQEGSIISCGKGHVNFWQLDQDSSSLSRKTGLLDPRDKPKYFTCLAFSSSGDLITGDSNGNIFVWGNGYNAVTKAIWGGHQGPVFSICVLKDGNILTGGGKDGRIVKYNHEYRLTGEEAVIPGHLGSVRAISQGAGSQILVGTTKNCILAGTMELSFREVVLGHADEVWCLAVRPGSSQFLTSGHDRMLHLWDSLSCSLVWSNDIGEQVQSGAFSVDGEIIVLTTVTGKWIVLDARTREVSSITQEGCDPLIAVRFAPDGQSLALISRSALYIYQVGAEYKEFTRRGRFSLQAGLHTALDWSADSQYVQVSGVDREAQAWRLPALEDGDSTLAPIARVKEVESLRDEEWDSPSSLLSWNTMGVWQDEGWDVTVGATSASLLVVGETTGKLRTYRYPAGQPVCKFVAASGHSGPVTGVRFLEYSSRVISTGGRDASVMQWSIES